MSKMTDEEWANVTKRLFASGGLREYIDELLASRAQVCSEHPISDKNRMLLYRAYDDGDGNTVTLRPREDGYFIGTFDGYEAVTATEIDGVLYSICSHSGGGAVTVLVGEEIVQNMTGVTFSSKSEAKAYIRGLAAK